MIIEPSKFARVSQGGWRFGPDRAGIVRALSQLLAAIEDGRAMPQSFTTAVDCALDDFTICSFTFRYAERERGYTAEERVLFDASEPIPELPGCAQVPPEEIGRGLPEPVFDAALLRTE